MWIGDRDQLIRAQRADHTLECGRRYRGRRGLAGGQRRKDREPAELHVRGRARPSTSTGGRKPTALTPPTSPITNGAVMPTCDRKAGRNIGSPPIDTALSAAPAHNIVAPPNATIEATRCVRWPFA